MTAKQIIEAVCLPDESLIEKVLGIIRQAWLDNDGVPWAVNQQAAEQLEPLGVHLGKDPSLNVIDAPPASCSVNGTYIQIPYVASERELNGALQHLRAILFHEFVHDKQIWSAPRPTEVVASADRAMLKKDAHGGYRLDMAAYRDNKQEIMARAASCVHSARRAGLTKDEFVRRLKTANLPGHAKDATWPLFAKYATEYAQKLM